MMTHEGRGGLPPTQQADPHWHLEVAVKVSAEGGGEEGYRTALRRRLRMSLGWMCMFTVYCSLDILLLVTLRMALNQTHQRGSKAAKFAMSE